TRVARGPLASSSCRMLVMPCAVPWAVTSATTLVIPDLVLDRTLVAGPDQAGNGLEARHGHDATLGALAAGTFVQGVEDGAAFGLVELHRLEGVIHQYQH